MRLSVHARWGLIVALAWSGFAAIVTDGQASLAPDGTTPALAGPESQFDEDIVVQITTPRPGERLRGRVEIAGYAADRRASSGSGLNERDVQLFLNDSTDQWNLLDYALAGRPSPDAAAALGPQFEQAGFWDAWETCSFPEASYKLIVWVSSLVAPGARSVASEDVYVESCGEGVPLLAGDFSNEPGGVFTFHLTEAVTRSSMLDPIYADFAAGIDARCRPPETACRYGLSFRELPGPGGTRTNSFYRLEVDPTAGSFSLGYSPPGDDPIVLVVPWTPAAAIRTGSAVNRMAVIAQGNWLRLFINGQQVGDAHDERRPWGQIGWVGASEIDGRAVDVEFDNLSISTPGPAEALSVLFPTPSSSFPSAGRVLFADDFSSPTSGWPRASADASTRLVGYEDGEYFVRKRPSSGGAPFVARSERFGDFRAEIDARLVAPTDDAYLYFLFRRQDNGDSYAFVVDPNDSTFTLRREQEGGGTTLVPWTSAAAIAPGTSRNRLGVRAQGLEMVLLVNGLEVGRALDNGWREGALAFGVGNLEDGPAEGRFTNLLVTSLD